MKDNGPNSERKTLFVRIANGSLWYGYYPTFTALVLYFGLIIGVWFNVVPYLTDIFNASTVAEAGGPQYDLYINSLISWSLVLLFMGLMLNEKWRPRWLIALAFMAIVAHYKFIPDKFVANTKYHVPFSWLFVIIVLLLIWGILFNIIRLLNKDTVNKIKSGQQNAFLTLPAVERTSAFEENVYNILSTKLFGVKPAKEVNARFLRLFGSVLVVTLLPVMLGWISLYGFKCCDGALIALVDTISLIGLLSIAEALTRLGALAGVNWLIRWGVRVPGFVVILFVVVSNPFESGQGVLNDHLAASEKYSQPSGTSFSLLQKMEQEDKARETNAKNGSKKTEEPLVIICASGGGTRAAMFTAGILTRIWQQQESAPSPQSEEDRYPGRSLLKNVNVMSGVSGGGLALAYLQEGLYRNLKDHPDKSRGQALTEFFNISEQKECRPEVKWYNQADTKPKNLTNYPFISTTDQSDLENDFDVNPYMNAMRQNFVAPCVTGYFWPFAGRGPSYERTWEQKFKWYEGTLDAPRRMGDFLEDEKTGKLPALILNALLTRTGSRLAITNLDAGDFAPLEKFGPAVDDLNASPSERKDLRYDPTPDAIITLRQLDPTWNMPLQAAVHAAANFPYALPTMRIARKTADGRQFPLHDDKNLPVSNIWGRPAYDIWEAIDGGGVNNYGTDAPMALLRHYHELDPEGLKKRGVLIFQIDAGELTINKTDVWWKPRNYQQSANGRWRGSQNADLTLNSLYLRELAYLFDDKEDPQPLTYPFDVKRTVGFVGKSAKYAYFKVRLGELATDHVLTFWHLNEAERSKLYKELVQDRQKEAIFRAAQWLRLTAQGIEPECIFDALK